MATQFRPSGHNIHSTSTVVSGGGGTDAGPKVPSRPPPPSTPPPATGSKATLATPLSDTGGGEGSGGTQGIYRPETAMYDGSGLPTKNTTKGTEGSFGGVPKTTTGGSREKGWVAKNPATTMVLAGFALLAIGGGLLGVDSDSVNTAGMYIMGIGGLAVAAVVAGKCTVSGLISF